MQDSALALALAALNLLSLLPYQSQLHPRWEAFALVGAQCLPLALRRVWPVPALICSGVLRDLYDGLKFGFAPLPLAPAIAFATVADRSRPALRWITVAATAGGVAYSQTLPGHNQPYDAIVQASIFGAAWAIGTLSRHRRAALAAAASRAARAEASLDVAAAGAAAAERARIARELHDVVAHHVSLIAVQAEAVGALLPARPAEASASADAIAATARQAMTELRRLLGVLRFNSADQHPFARTVPADSGPLPVPPGRAAGVGPGLRPPGDLQGLGPGGGPAARRGPDRLPDHPGGADQRPPARPRLSRDRHRRLRRRRLSVEVTNSRPHPAPRPRHPHDPATPHGPATATPLPQLPPPPPLLHALGHAGRRLRPGRDRRAGRLLRRLARPRPGPGRRLHRDRPIAADVTAPTALRVLVADDQELVRAGFRLILEASGFVVVGEAPDGAAAVELAALHRPDVVLMDIRMPVLDGIAATRQLTASGPAAPKVVILTTFDLDDYVYEALRAGASGFLLKDAPRADLIAAVRVAAAGDALLAPSVTRRLIEAFAARPAEALPSPSRLASLTPRERDILLLLARGRTNLEIAARPGGQRGHGQDPRRPPARQARPQRPRPGRHPRLRNRRRHPRPPQLAASPWSPTPSTRAAPSVTRLHRP